MTMAPTELDSRWKEIDWSVHATYATVRGRRIHYADFGSGPVTIFIHGQGGSWEWWLRTVPTLARHGRVIAVDLPGFGGSDPIHAGDVFDEHVATIVASPLRR
jgi:pimeloyl-ACP methyl ester carboxylesterase